MPVNCCYSAAVGERSIEIGLSVCVCLSVREHIRGTADPIFTKFFMHVPRGRGSVLLWRRCDMLRTSGFLDDVAFGCNGPHGVFQHRGRSFMSVIALLSLGHIAMHSVRCDLSLQM